MRPEDQACPAFGSMAVAYWLKHIVIVKLWLYHIVPVWSGRSTFVPDSLWCKCCGTMVFQTKTVGQRSRLWGSSVFQPYGCLRQKSLSKCDRLTASQFSGWERGLLCEWQSWLYKCQFLACAVLAEPSLGLHSVLDLLTCPLVMLFQFLIVLPQAVHPSIHPSIQRSIEEMLVVWCSHCQHSLGA